MNSGRSRDFPRSPVARRASGVGLVEALAVVAVAGLVIAMAVPHVAALRDSDRGGAAARRMAALFRDARWDSVAERRIAGFRFDRDARGWFWQRVVDGDGDGLRTGDIDRGVDVRNPERGRIEDRVAGAWLGFPSPGPYPKIPPSRGNLADTVDPIQFGRSDLVSFTPLGRSSSGTVYVTDRAGNLYGVVLFGPSTRVRIWRWDRGERRWKRD